MNTLKASKYFLMIAVVLAAFAQQGPAQAGTETGKGNEWSNSDLSSYCDSSIGILSRAKRIALEEYADGDSVGARSTLVQGLMKALKSFQTLGGSDAPLTRIAISRGLEINSAFHDDCRAQDCLGLQARTALYFLGKYYDYILGPVSNLDRQYYIPYIERYHHCHDYNCMPQDFGNEFFTAYKDSARALLGFYNGEDPHSGLPDALAKDSYELHVAERVLSWAAADLNADLWRRSFACLIQELGDSSQDIAAFNAGDMSRFKTSRRAVMFARDVSQNSANELMRRDGCVAYPVWR